MTMHVGSVVYLLKNILVGASLIEIIENTLNEMKDTIWILNI